MSLDLGGWGVGLTYTESRVGVVKVHGGNGGITVGVTYVGVIQRNTARTLHQEGIDATWSLAKVQLTNRPLISRSEPTTSRAMQPSLHQHGSLSWLVLGVPPRKTQFNSEVHKADRDRQTSGEEINSWNNRFLVVVVVVVDGVWAPREVYLIEARIILAAAVRIRERFTGGPGYGGQGNSIIFNLLVGGGLFII